MGKIIRNGIEYSGSYDNAISINYDNTNSGLNATTVQEGIDEIKEDLKPHANVNPIVNLLTTETGYALDATQGKVLDDKISAMSNSLNIKLHEITTGFSTIPLYVFESSNTCILRANFQATTDIKWDDVIIILPEEVKPFTAFFGTIFDRTAGTHGTISIGQNGRECDVIAQPLATIPAGNWVILQLVYFKQ